MWTATFKTEEKYYLCKQNSLAIITKMLINVDLASNLYHFPVIER